MEHGREDVKGLSSSHGPSQGLGSRRDLPASHTLTTRKLTGPPPYPPPLRVTRGQWVVVRCPIASGLAPQLLVLVKYMIP